eukprot:scaffold20552_cov161-Skeletonema_dohrnii-CCMP3373.AAC.10
MRRYYKYTGEDGEVPWDATHVIVDKSITVIPARAFDEHPNIVEVILHDKVERIERAAFNLCPSLRRVIMPGVKVVERHSFYNCEALTNVECGKLEIIREDAFDNCQSLRSIDLSSAKVIDRQAFARTALTNVKFGAKLERFEEQAFVGCRSLERITIPFKDGMITHSDTFYLCQNLKLVDLVEGELHETIAALQLGEWRNDMYEKIDSINQILPDTPARGLNYDNEGKAWAIRTWVRSVLRRIVHYIAEHQRFLNEEVETTLQLVLPQDIVMNNVLPFLELPSFTFEVGDDEEEEEDSDDEEGGNDEDDTHLA